MEWLRRRQSKQDEERRLMAVARVHQDALWTFQSAAGEALETRSWKESDHILEPLGADDMHKLAAVLTAAEWRAYTAAARHRREAAKWPPALSDTDLLDVLTGYIWADEARRALFRLSLVEPSPHRRQKLGLDSALITAELPGRFADKGLAARWVEALTSS